MNKVKLIDCAFKNNKHFDADTSASQESTASFFRLIEEITRFLRNLATYIPNYTASHPT
jgi:hypothetical protein